MKRQFLLLSSLLLLLFYSASSSCPSHCGSIEIPFPFGIGQGCYLDKWYEVTCDSSSSSAEPIPFLPKINKEIVNITLPSTYNGIRMSYALLRIKIPITSMGCSNEVQEEATSTLNLTGSPFYIGYRNTLVAVGCNNKASLTEVQQNMVGCESTCGKITTLPTFPFSYDGIDTCYEPFCNARNKREETNCNGFRCCQASVPEGIRQLIAVKVETIDGNETRRGCNVAFLTDEAISLSNVTDPQWFHTRGYATVETAWFLQTTNLSFVSSIGCIRRPNYENSQESIRRETNCQCENVTMSEISYTRCACTEGYRGNPHVRGGCKDINECEEPYNDGSPRCGVGICVNIPGGYRCKAKKTRALVIGFSVSFSVLVLVFGIYWLYKFMERRRRIMLKKRFFKRNGGLLLEQQVNSTNMNVEKTRIFSSKELEKATENFSVDRVLGQGGQGTVYKGMLVDGRIVAVKKAKVVDEDKLEEFINEVVILSQINHRNIVKLLGCCLETDVPVLIYEFIPNGNLYENLHGVDESDGYKLTTWEARLRIAIDIAGALAYLHSAASCPIYHRDIKSTNILLDEKYRAKVSDFGTSRSITIDQTHLTTLFAGTIGYMDPEYFQSCQFTDKSDVYSFGVVLVELITGEKAIPVARNDETRGLVVQFVETMKQNKVLDIIDGRIKEGDIKIEQVVAVAKLARKCLRMKRNNRPNMREVSSELDRIRLSDQEVDVNEEEEEEEEEEDAIEIDIEDSWSVDDPNDIASPTLDKQPLYPQQTWSI